MAKRSKKPAVIEQFDWTTIDCTALVSYVHDHITARQRPTAADLEAIQTYTSAQLMKAHWQLQNEISQRGIEGDWLDCVFYGLSLNVGIDPKTAEYNCPPSRWMAKEAA